jgi:hypothetical protein
VKLKGISTGCRPKYLPNFSLSKGFRVQEVKEAHTGRSSKYPLLSVGTPVESGVGEAYEDIRCRAAAFPKLFMSNDL